MNQIPANWYADPAGSAQLRYWDGAAWTNHLRDAVAVPVHQPTPPNFAPPVQHAAPPQQADYFQQPQQPARADPYAQPQGNAQYNPFGAYLPAATANQLAGASQFATGLAGNSNGGGLIGSVAAVAIGVLGLLFSGLIFDWFSASAEPAAGSISTTGTVVELETDSDGCSPIVEFTTEGKTYRAYSSVTQSPCPFSIGDAAELTYLASSPESSARLQSDADALGVMRIVAYGIFGLLTVFGGFSIFRSIQAMNRGRQAWGG